MSYHHQTFVNTIVDSSKSMYFKKAILEWDITDWFDSRQNTRQCICGKQNIRYLYTIKNKINQKSLDPVGSSCIKKFEREDLNEKINLQKSLFLLYEKIEKKEFITLKNDFTRKSLKYLNSQSIFTPSKFNNFNSENDYEFLLDMFNMRKKPSDKQQSKIKKLIYSYIIPYLRKTLTDKIKP